MNRTLTRAVDGKTPYEAAFGKKPDLCQVHKWGEKVWVRTKTGDKLSGCVTEGHWLGIDERSKGLCYWPDKQTVSVEWNVHLDNRNMSVSRLKGEDWQFIKTRTDIPASAPNTAVAPISPAPSQTIPLVKPPLTGTDTTNTAKPEDIPAK
jgi:hypothetical protein